MLSRLTPYFSTAVLAALIFYFGFQALTGDRGLLEARERDRLLVQKQAELTQLHARRKAQEALARLLR